MFNGALLCRQLHSLNQITWHFRLAFSCPSSDFTFVRNSPIRLIILSFPIGWCFNSRVKYWKRMTGNWSLLKAFLNSKENLNLVLIFRTSKWYLLRKLHWMVRSWRFVWWRQRAKQLQFASENAVLLKAQTFMRWMVRQLYLQSKQRFLV